MNKEIIEGIIAGINIFGKDNIIKDVKHIARRNLGLPIKRNANECIESIYWHYKEYKRLIRKYKNDNKYCVERIDKEYGKIERRIIELQSIDENKQIYRDYNKYYEMLNEIENTINKLK